MLHQPNQHCLDDFDLLKRGLISVIDYLSHVPVPAGLMEQYQDLKQIRKDLDND